MNSIITAWVCLCVVSSTCCAYDRNTNDGVTLELFQLANTEPGLLNLVSLTGSRSVADISSATVSLSDSQHFSMPLGVVLLRNTSEREIAVPQWASADWRLVLSNDVGVVTNFQLVAGQRLLPAFADKMKTISPYSSVALVVNNDNMSPLNFFGESNETEWVYITLKLTDDRLLKSNKIPVKTLRRKDVRGHSEILRKTDEE